MMDGKPVRSALAPVSILLMAAVLGVLIAYCEIGCSPSSEPKYPSYCYSEKAFGQKLQDCVRAAANDATTEAEFRAASKACRQTVHRNCGIVMTITNRAEVAP